MKQLLFTVVRPFGNYVTIITIRFVQTAIFGLMFVPLFCLPLTAQTIIEVGDYHLRMHPDGSGSFGLPEHIEQYTRGRFWSVRLKLDEMTDESIITAHKTGRFAVGIFLSLANEEAEALAIMGHDYPGRSAMIRVGNNPAIETSEQGLTLLTEELDKQLRSGEIVRIRRYKWPRDYPTTHEIDVDGYSKLVDFLRNIRPNLAEFLQGLP